MAFFTTLVAIVFYFHLEFVLLDHLESPNVHRTNCTLPITQTSSSIEKNHLEKITPRDVLLSGIDGSAKIEEKIINVATQYASKCLTFKRMNLSTGSHWYTGDLIKTIKLGSVNAVFDDINVGGIPSQRKSYSTSIQCDSARMTRIEVKLPKDLKISAYITITETNNSSSKFDEYILETGRMNLILKDYSVSKEFPIRSTEANGTRPKTSYTTSMLEIKGLPSKLQMEIYTKMPIFLQEIESPLTRFLTNQLEVEFGKSGISVADDCSKFMNTDKNPSKTEDSSCLFNAYYFHNLYQIPLTNVHDSDWDLISAGPILIDGLSSFDSITEFIVSETEVFNTDEHNIYYLVNNIPILSELETKKMIIKFKTKELKGKVEWIYNNSKLLSSTFILEYIQFIVEKTITFQHDKKFSGSYAKPNNTKVEVSLDIGNIKINTMNFNNSKSEENILKLIYPYDLVTSISLGLTESLNKKIQNASFFVNCT